jgi:hypothetical protein
MLSMSNMDEPRDLASNSRLRARLILAIFAVVSLFFVGVTQSPLKSGFADAPDRGPGDIQLYRAEVDRIRAGETYYDAAAGELRARGYPTHSVFNWRTPLPVWLLAVLPDLGIGNAILGACGLVLVCLSFSVLAEEGSLRSALLGVLLLSGALLPCLLGDLVVMSELWSGVLVALSAACFAKGRATAGVLAGISALFFRELAAPYVLVCMALAVSGRRYRELGTWCVGLAAYAVFFDIHVWQVLPRAGSEGLAQVGSWIRFGGAGFLISAAQMNAYLLLLPQWITALYLACALLGCAEWNTAAGRRIGLSIAAYAIAFSIAGNDFNQYWGSLIAPLLALAACRAPAAIGRLLIAAEPAAWASRRHVGVAGR